jgi:hypothetical protein
MIDSTVALAPSPSRPGEEPARYARASSVVPACLRTSRLAPPNGRSCLSDPALDSSQLEIALVTDTFRRWFC